jgi:hypothetical protein
MVPAHEVLVRDSWFGFTGATVILVGVFQSVGFQIAAYV